MKNKSIKKFKEFDNNEFVSDHDLYVVPINGLINFLERIQNMVKRKQEYDVEDMIKVLNMYEYINNNLSIETVSNLNSRVDKLKGDDSVPYLDRMKKIIKYYKLI